MLSQFPRHQDESDPATSKWSWLNLIQLAAIAITALFLSRHTLSDLDIWLHWRVGRDILAGNLPHTNFYSFTATDHLWIDHEWLFQVLIAMVAKLTSLWHRTHELTETLAVGWNTLRIFLSLGLVLLLGRPLYRRQGSPTFQDSFNPALAPVLMLSLALLWPRLTLRPELLSYILLAWAIPLVEQCFTNSPSTQKGWRSSRAFRAPGVRLFLLTLLWAQIHGFAAMVPALILLAGILGPLQNKLKVPAAKFSFRTGMWALLASFLALGLTPAGWRGWSYPLIVLGQFTGQGPDLQHTISELVPLAQSPNSLAWTLVAYKICLGWGLLRIALAIPRVNLLRSILFLVAAMAAWSSQRNLGFMAVTFALLHQGSWGPASHWVTKILNASPGQFVKKWLPPLVTLGMVILWSPPLISNSFYLHEGVSRRFGGGLTPANYPQRAASALAAETPSNIFANLDAAAYLIGNTQNPLFIDGRTEAYPPAVWDLYNIIKKGDHAALRILDKYAVKGICLTLSSGAFDNLARTLQSSDKWAISQAGPGGVLWLPQGAQPAEANVLREAATTTELMAKAETAPIRQADYFLAAYRLAMLAGDTGRAQTFLHQGLQVSPRHPLLLHNAGNLEMAAGKFSAAEDHFAQALAVNPRLAGSALNAGVCALRQDQLRKATSWFEKSLAINPRKYQAWANLGTSRLKSGDRPGAIAAYEQAVVLNPQAERLQKILRELRNR